MNVYNKRRVSNKKDKTNNRQFGLLLNPSRASFLTQNYLQVDREIFRLGSSRSIFLEVPDQQSNQDDNKTAVIVDEIGCRVGRSFPERCHRHTG